MDPVEEPKNVDTFISSLSQVWKHYETTRNLVAFFFLGLTNNFGYVIMLCAAYDLLGIMDKLSDKTVESTNFLRTCNDVSTGAILLANIVPCTIVKLIVPFLPLIVDVRMALVVILTGVGFVLVALAISKLWIICGVCLVSFACGLGESSILAYMVFFRTKNVLSTWSSGTGMAGLLGSFAYSFMMQLGLTPQTTIYTMLCMPLIMAFSFWVVIERPMVLQYEQDRAGLRMVEEEEERHKREARLKSLSSGIKVENQSSLMEKIRIIPTILLTYTLWYGLVYLFEYFINQGLFELMQIPESFLDYSAQYRWYNTIYQLGVFISRSSMNIVSINRTYLTAAFQGVNAIIFLMEAIYGYINYLYIILVIIFWEGLLGGACYVNTFRRIMQEMPPSQREFAMAINSIGDSVMISLAGAVAIPVHDAICHMAPTYRRQLPNNTVIDNY